MKKDLLTLMLTRYTFCISNPATARMVFLAHRIFADDSFTADLLHALLCSNGEPRAAAHTMLRKRHAPERVKNFEMWAHGVVNGEPQAEGGAS
jgi:hypothetical protein